MGDILVEEVEILVIGRGPVKTADNGGFGA